MAAFTKPSNPTNLYYCLLIQLKIIVYYQAMTQWLILLVQISWSRTGIERFSEFAGKKIEKLISPKKASSYNKWTIIINGLIFFMSEFLNKKNWS